LLTQLSLQSNRFTGALPNTLCAVITLDSLEAQDNDRLTCYPSCLNNISTTNFGNAVPDGCPSDVANALCGLVAATNIATAFNGTHSMWACDSGGEPESNVCVWEGVSCSGANVVQLYLNHPAADLAGSIPLTIGSLTTMTNFNVDSNLLNGTLPATIGSLTRLQTLILTGNFFDGM
jgi:hypothetical protein